MPLTKALRSFKGRYGHIRAGTTFNCAPAYFGALEKKGWVEQVRVDMPRPSDNRAIPQAPNRAGTEKGGVLDPGKVPAAPAGGTSQNTDGTELGPSDTADPQDAGPAVTSRSLRRGRASTRKTSNLSVSGGRTPKPDPNNLDG